MSALASSGAAPAGAHGRQAAERGARQQAHSCGQIATGMALAGPLRRAAPRRERRELELSRIYRPELLPVAERLLEVVAEDLLELA